MRVKYVDELTHSYCVYIISCVYYSNTHRICSLGETRRMITHVLARQHIHVDRPFFTLLAFTLRCIYMFWSASSRVITYQNDSQTGTSVFPGNSQNLKEDSCSLEHRIYRRSMHYFLQESASTLELRNAPKTTGMCKRRLFWGALYKTNQCYLHTITSTRLSTSESHRVSDFFRVLHVQWSSTENGDNIERQTAHRAISDNKIGTGLEHAAGAFATTELTL
ncbi:hypothetical protein J3A83DRAFT_1690042 [Scleroderma citrinum]